MDGGTFNTDYTSVCTFSSIARMSWLVVDLWSVCRCELPPQSPASIQDQRFHCILPFRPGTLNFPSSLKNSPCSQISVF